MEAREYSRAMRQSNMRLSVVVCLLVSLFVVLFVEAKEKRKKSLLDLSERDVQRIYEQWEVCISPFSFATYRQLCKL